jgi:hypothetical protein
MKKLLIIAVASCLFIASCKKADVAPIPQPVNTISKSATSGHCYLLSNIETTIGFAEYRVTYTDCNNTVQNEPLPFGQRLMLCLQNGTVQTNFAYTLADRGDCLTAR